MASRRDHWETVYTTKAEADVSWFQASPEMSVALIKAAGATADTAIIDIGGGASRLVDALLQEGIGTVAVLDLSQAALAAAQKRLGALAEQVEWIACDVTAWAPARRYDIWHDRAAFHFLTERSDQAAYVERLKSALHPGGQVIIGTFALDGPEKCSGLPVQRYDAESLHRTLGADFELVETRSETHATPWRSTQSFQFARLRRA